MSEENQNYPPLAQQAKNFGLSLSKLFQRAMNGEKMFATNEIQQERYKICQGCEKYDLMQDRCRECGCFVRQKIAFGHEICPINKWGSDETRLYEWLDQGAPDRKPDEAYELHWYME